MLAPNIEGEVKAILEKKGKSGWLRINECAKRYGKDDTSRETKFYRWRKQVEKGRVRGFQILKLPGNISFIGLESSDPKTIESLISEDKKLAKSVKSGLGLFEWWNQRDERKAQERKEAEKRRLLESIHYRELLAKLGGDEWEAMGEVAKKDRELYKELYGENPQ